jgi:hypothetical protein
MIKKALIFILLLTLVNIAQANYTVNGTPLLTVKQGHVNGNVYVGGGHGLTITPYIHNFNVPAFTSVEWARLYVNVYGGTENYCAWVNTTFNSNAFPRVNIGNNNSDNVCKGYLDNNSNVYGAGHGIWLIYYNVTSLVQSGTNAVTITDAAVGGGFDGRVYGAVLVAAYSGGSNPKNITYWINDGHESFHYTSNYFDAGTPVSAYNSNTTNFGALSGTVLRANLTNVFSRADGGTPFVLKFNNNQLVTSGTTNMSICPSCFGDPSGNCPVYASGWIEPCRLDGGGWSDDPNNPYWDPLTAQIYFDIDIWNVTAYTGSSSNSAYFNRSTDSFVGWMLSVLTAETSGAAPGPNVVVTRNNVSFGNITRGGTREILASLTLQNTGTASANIQAKFINSSGATYGLVNASNVIGGSNFSIGPNTYETALSNGNFQTAISTLAPGATVNYDAILHVPIAQTQGNYAGTVEITWS